LADEYDAVFTRAIAAKERALDSNDPAVWQEALDLFAKADRVRSTKEATYELGSAAARLRQDDVAAEAFEASLSLGLGGTAADKARAFISEHLAEMARVVVVGPAGAEVWVSDRLRARLPLSHPVVVFAGQRHVRISLGARSVTRDFVVKPGTTETLDVSGAFAAPERPPSPPPTSAPVAPDGGSPPTTTRSPLAWPLTIGGASFVLVGSVTALVASSNVSSHRDRLATLCAVRDGSDACRLAHPGKQSSAQDEVDAIATWKATRTAGFVGLGMGVVATGVGVILLSTSSSRSAQPTTWTLGPARAGTGVSLSGQL